MQEIEIIDQHFWKPFERFGLTSVFWNLNPKTIIYTWIVISVLLITSLFIKYVLIKKQNNTLTFIVVSFIRSFSDLISQTLGKFSLNHFFFITSLFIFIATSNIISVIPWMEEPTTNANTTVALGIIAFLYVQIYSIKANGFSGYLKELCSPFFLLFPLNVMGEISKIISTSFRLFGNIFGGSVIAKLWTSAISGSIITEIIGIFSGINLIIVVFFIFFEGFIQAFVFSMLTLTYLSLIQHEH